MDEIWKDIVGYEGLYQVSNMGHVRSLFRYKKVLKPLKASGGYYQVQLSNRKIIKSLLLHRLVACAFLDNVNNLPCVNHIDGDKSNNKVTNLEWCTYSDNEKHSYSILKKRPVRSRLGMVGSKCYNHKHVLQLSENDEIINEFESRGEASRKTGASSGNIWSAMNGRRTYAGGYKWKYKNI